MNRIKRIASMFLATLLSVGSMNCLMIETNASQGGERHVYSDLSDNIIITAFHPISSKELLNEEQFKLAADAGIDVMEYCGGMRVTDAASMKKALEYAAKVGILCNVYDDRIQNNALAMGKDAVFAIFDEYKGKAGLGGYYLLDESVKPNDYAELINATTAYDPDSTPFINNFPDIWNDGYYTDRLADLAHLITDKRNFILSFDNYPFGAEKNSVDENALFKHFEAIRKAGNETGTRTGFYAQVIPYGYRKLNGSETLYHINVGLAYGCTEINYFAWGTPNEELCPGFGDAVIDRNGKPTDLYYDIINIDKYAHTVGKTLVKLRSEEVYHAGSASNNPVYNKVPADFFVQTDSYVILSRMQDKTTGRDYLMIVNKKMNSAQNVTLNLTGVGSLQQVSQTTGELTDVSGYKDGTLTVSLDAGAAILLALPEGTQYGTPETIPADGNLTENAIITASSSAGSDGWFVNRLNDGKKFSEARFPGWQGSSASASEWLIFDLGEKKTFNRLDLYPARDGNMSGAYFPIGMTVSVSDDGITYTEVKSIADIVRPTFEVPVYRFENTVGRYVKLELKKVAGGMCELSEVSLYNDSGSVPEPETTLYEAEDTDPTVNVALNKPIVDYSSNYEFPHWGNSIAFATDGDYTTNWACDVDAAITNTSASIEFITIDLGNTYNLNRVKLYPFMSGGEFAGGTMPDDIDVLLSANGIDFTSVKHITGASTTPADLQIAFNPTVGRYIKLIFTGLLPRADVLNRYMVQFSEIEAYVYVDELTSVRNELKRTIAQARGIMTDFYTADSVIKITEALNEAEKILSENSDSKDKLVEATGKLKTAIDALKPIPMTDNLALSKRVTVTSNYPAPEGIFAPEYLTDGLNPDHLAVYDTHNGWSSSISDGAQRNTPIDITIDLEELKTVTAIFMQPAYYDTNYFPTEYNIETSTDGKTWQTVTVADDVKGLINGDVLRYKVDNVLARYIRVHITENSPYTAGNSYISQIGEIEVFGAVDIPEETTEADTAAPATEAPETSVPVTTETEGNDTTVETETETDEQNPPSPPTGQNSIIIIVITILAAAVAVSCFCLKKKAETI